MPLAGCKPYLNDTNAFDICCSSQNAKHKKNVHSRESHLAFVKDAQPSIAIIWYQRLDCH